MTRPVMLVVLDGFGIGDGGPADATARAHTPFLDHARRQHPCARIETSGEAVGLPPGQMGNSEVGHMTMGAGRIIEMDITRIGKALRGDALEHNPALRPGLRGGRAAGRDAAPDGPRLRRRRPQPPGASGGAARALSAPRRAAGPARVPRRPRHAAALGPRLRARAAPARRGLRRTRRDRDRALLRDGPRSALGAHRRRLPGDRRGRGPPRGDARSPRSSRPTRATKATSS